MKLHHMIDFGIIDLSKLCFIDPIQSSVKNKTVNIISKIITKFSLCYTRHGFIATLKDNGRHILKDLIA